MARVFKLVKAHKPDSIFDKELGFKHMVFPNCSSVKPKVFRKNRIRSPTVISTPPVTDIVTQKMDINKKKMDIMKKQPKRS